MKVFELFRFQTIYIEKQKKKINYYINDHHGLYIKVFMSSGSLYRNYLYWQFYILFFIIPT